MMDENLITRSLYVSLARCDGQPDNHILDVLEDLRRHGFEFSLHTYDAEAKQIRFWCTWLPNRTWPTNHRARRPNVVSRNRAVALAALATDLGQDIDVLTGVQQLMEA
ncbi:hypothetical protein [Burkholderia sp. S171]|uniref:hypothetical protein n=1 Tax=Burkholderia sp. S171 TaxID=1641860 RepID=UPI00131B9B52|nr:hypothetical protein [Burkholderia sp. S171]